MDIDGDAPAKMTEQRASQDDIVRGASGPSFACLVLHHGLSLRRRLNDRCAVTCDC